MTGNVIIPTIENGKIAFPVEQQTGESTREFMLRAFREALDWIETNELTIDHAEKLGFEET